MCYVKKKCRVHLQFQVNIMNMCVGNGILVTDD